MLPVGYKAETTCFIPGGFAQGLRGPGHSAFLPMLCPKAEAGAGLQPCLRARLAEPSCRVCRRPESVSAPRGQHDEHCSRGHMGQADTC